MKSNSFNGEIKAFIRPKLLKDNSVTKLQSMVVENEFSSQRALVLGGSRGLGEVTVKLLSLSGADVKFTYFKSKDDAEKIYLELQGIGIDEEKIQYLSYDVINSNSLELDNIINWKPTHIYYFPTPFIFAGNDNVFNYHLFIRYCDYFLKGLINIIDYYKLENIRVFCPSSVAIDELPNGMWEYSIAKTSAELLFSFINKFNNNIKIHFPRLPRMATDQTLSLLPVKTARPENIMLKHLKEFNKI